MGLPKISEEEFNALWDLFNVTNGHNWYWNDKVNSGIPWNFSSGFSHHNPCKDRWQGISCTCTRSENETHRVADISYTSYDDNSFPDEMFDCHIEKLQLLDYGLDGYLPESIGDLSSLTHIHFGTGYSTQNDQVLTGSIPLSIGKLNKLKLLSIYNSKITGSIPSSLGQLTSLTFLDLDSNSLTGSIPSSLGQLTALTTLYLDSNSLTGSIPSSLGQLTALSLSLIHI